MLLPLGDDLKKDTIPVVTIALILANVLVYAIMFNQQVTGEFMTFEPSEENDRIATFFYNWGLVPAELSQGNVMGLLANIFIHATIFHLVGNMIVLWAFGPSLESLLGSTTFIVMYILWGILASLAQYGIDMSSEIPLVGASGAIAGVIGGYMIMFGYAARIRMFMLILVYPFRFYVPASVFGFFWIMSQLWNASFDVSGDISGIAWMCHIGGFATGMIMMLIFKNQTDRLLMQNSEGELVFRTREELQETQITEAEFEEVQAIVAARAEEFIEAQVCSDCGTKLGKEFLIAERLMRCPNEDCLHLNYVEEDPNPPMIATPTQSVRV